VPRKFHDQIASTGFSVARAHDDVNPFYLHFALRLPSTLEQFRKWSTGSSYPAILDEDVAKTLIPVPSAEEQDRIALLLVQALDARDQAIRKANYAWNQTLGEITSRLSGSAVTPDAMEKAESGSVPITIADIQETIRSLPELTTDGSNASTEAQAVLI
jgi:type I restriction enzyme S subunit